MSGDGSGWARTSAFRARSLTAPRFSLGKWMGCVHACSVMSDSVWPHRRRPTSLPCPWDSPGNYTGVILCWPLLLLPPIPPSIRVFSNESSLFDPLDYSLAGSSVHGIFRARILEKIAISFSRESSQPKDQTHISCISCIGRWVLYQLSHQESTPVKVILSIH